MRNGGQVSVATLNTIDGRRNLGLPLQADTGMIGSDRLEIIKQVNLQHGFQPNVQEVGNSANLASFYITALDGHQLSPACNRRVKLSETSFSGYFFDPERLEAGDDEPSDKTESSLGSKVR